MTESLVWFKSSYSSANGQCVESARTTDAGMAVRDSRQPNGAVLQFGAREWQVFTEGLKNAAR
jgi:hypothetical protein